METRLLRFNELSTGQLYDLLRLRSAIFVVEQKCIYPDLDGKDDKALHLLGYEGERLAAYTRIFAPGDYTDRASIGRVAVREGFRGRGYGKEIMKASIEAVQKEFGSAEVAISAQLYLRKFYDELGFRAVGETYLEDGIPHIKMLLKSD